MSPTKRTWCALVACIVSSSIVVAQAPERAVFIVRIGNDTLAVENAVLQGDSAVQATTLSMTGDSATLHSAIGGVTASRRIAAPARAVPFMNLSGTSLELILRTSRAIGGDTTHVPVIVGPGHVITATVMAVGSDSAVVVIGAVALRARTDRAGRFLGATVPSQGLEIDRRDGDSPASTWMPVRTS